MPGCDILADNKEENPLPAWGLGFLLRKNKGVKSSPAWEFGFLLRKNKEDLKCTRN